MDLRGHGSSVRTGRRRGRYDWSMDAYVREDLPAAVRYVLRATGERQTLTDTRLAGLGAEERDRFNRAKRRRLSAERLAAGDRARVIDELRRLRPIAPKLEMYDGALEAYTRPPASPAECTFARTTECLSADLTRRITPCQFGGNPDCANCGCIASASLEAIARHRLPGGIPVRAIFDASVRIGNAAAWIRGD